MNTSNIAGRKKKASAHNVRGRLQRGINFMFFDQAKKHPTQALQFTMSERSALQNPLKNYREWPGVAKPSSKEGIVYEDDVLHFIKMGKSPRDRAKIGLAGFLENYIGHTFNVSDFPSDGNGERLRRYLQKYPWDTKDISDTDALCWTLKDTKVLWEESAKAKAKRLTREAKKEKETGEQPVPAPPRMVNKKIPVPSKFQSDLILLQECYYKYIRASIFLYCDSKAENHLKVALKIEDRRRGNTVLNFCDEKRRISWEFIQDIILNEICTYTVGAYYCTSTPYKPQAEKTGRPCSIGANV
jgi:hypothetical protein